MKKIITGCIALICSALSLYAASDDAGLKVISFKEMTQAIEKIGDSDMGGQDLSGTTYFQQENGLLKWDQNGAEKSCGALFVFIDGMPEKELKNINIILKGGYRNNHIRYKTINGRPCVIYHLEGTQKGQKYDKIEIVHPDYGAATYYEAVIKTGNLYRLDIENERRVTVNFTSKPEGATVILDGKAIGKTPLEQKNLKVGEYTLTMQPANPRNAHTVGPDTINITPDNTLFNRNLTNKKGVTFKTSNRDAWIDVKDATGNTIKKGQYRVELKDVDYGTYTVDVWNNGEYVVKDETYNINDHTQHEIDLRGAKTKKIRFVSIQNTKEVEGAELIIDGKKTGLQTRCTYELEYGRHNVRMNYFGKSQEQYIDVNDATDPDMTLTLPHDFSKKIRWNPFEVDYQHRDWAVEFHHLYRNWRYKSYDQAVYMDKNLIEKQHEDGIGLGVSYNHSFMYGQGLRTGIHWHYFFNTMKYDNGDVGHQHEHRLYIPLQYQFMMPLSEEAGVYVAVGIAGSFGLSNKESYHDYDMDDKFEVNLGFGQSDNWAMPESCQWSVPLSVGAHWKGLSLRFDYDFGLNNNKSIIKTYVNEDYQKKTSFKMRMMSFTLGFAF